MKRFLSYFKKNKKEVVSTAFLVVGSAFLIYFVAVNYGGRLWKMVTGANDQSNGNIAVSDGLIGLEVDTSLYPTDKLFLTKTRQAYKDGDIVLRIPRLNLVASVVSGVEDEDLIRGPGLYEYAQTPSAAGNPNVSIAGHRDTYGCEFYYVDTITQGDLLYLEYDGKEYVYQYRTTYDVEAGDWEPVYARDFSSLTLTSCTPLGTSLKRIVVVSELIEVNPL